MRICVVNSPTMAQAFKSLGHDVLALSPGPGVSSLPGLLKGHGFEPELVLDVEFLGPRTILAGLTRLDCPKLFWSVDTHLNAWWHRSYGRLFDAVLTTQDGWISRLRTLGLPTVEHLPWYGSRRPFKPWDRRSVDLCFVGRVTSERPVRRRMVDFLKKCHGLLHMDGVNHQEMMARYDDARLVPNESIFSEVNFRLFEAASCGCLVLNQAVSSDITRVFEPGVEVAVFEDVLELEALVRRYRARPDEAERMGRAAWARVNAEHLPEHRAAWILELAHRHRGAAPRGDRAEAFLWESLFHLNEAGMVESDLESPLAAMLERRWSSDGFAALLHALHHTGRDDNALEFLHEAAGGNLFANSFEVNFTASSLAFRLGHRDLARAFWLRHALSRGGERLPALQGDVGFWMGWAGQCELHWLPMSSGFRYSAGRGLPRSAMECLMEANELDAGNLDVVRRMDAIQDAEGSGCQGFRLYVLSHLSLHRPHDWRIGLDLGLANLRTMRMDQGLEELVLALDTARAKGQEAYFRRVLAAQDSTGMIAAVLAEVASGSVES